MARIRGKNTGPELAVRKVLHRLGFRFRLHRRDLPGRPDLVLPRHRTAVLVHGCFWHRHQGCKNATTPKSNVEFWEAKFARNTARDAETEQALTACGWRVLTVWECETVSVEQLQAKLAGALSGTHDIMKST